MTTKIVQKRQFLNAQKEGKGANFDAGNFSQTEFEVLDMMPSITHF